MICTKDAPVLSHGISLAWHFCFHSPASTHESVSSLYRHEQILTGVRQGYTMYAPAASWPAPDLLISSPTVRRAHVCLCVCVCVCVCGVFLFVLPTCLFVCLSISPKEHQEGASTYTRTPKLHNNRGSSTSKQRTATKTLTALTATASTSASRKEGLSKSIYPAGKALAHERSQQEPYCRNRKSRPMRQ